LTITLRPHQREAVNAMWQNNKGQVIIPTGGGKTICMIDDAITNMEVRHHGQTFVVVAPRILLAEQLCSEFLELVSPSHNAHILHVHSGETHHFSTTKSEKIHLFANTARTAGENVIIFTTYHSLHRVMEADIEVNTIYFDEAHNSVQRNFFPPTEHFAVVADRCYFFTATPKHSLSVFKPGMNDAEVYGKVICNVPAPKLVEEGYILPPKVVVKQLDMVQDKQMIADRDSQNLIDTIDENSLDKILVCARSTKQIVKLLAESDFRMELAERGYSCMYITAKTGGVIDGQKVNREVFFDTLNAWGKDPSKKFVVLHHSILSEGINVSGLEAVLFMRNMDYIGISQSIGRVIRLGGTQKTFGLVCVPVYDKVGISTAKSVQAVVDTVFQQGQPAISVVRR
jgi:superfamily II DNA or RNA helicase